MKKKYFIILIAILFVFIFLNGFINASKESDYENIKKIEKTLDYDSYNKIASIKDKNNHKVYARVKLNYNSDKCLINCKANGTITLYSDGKLSDGFEFYKGKKQNSLSLGEIDNYEFYIKKNGKFVRYSYEILGGSVSGITYEWELIGKKKPYEIVDWIGEFFGYKIEEWALWGTGSELMLYYDFEDEIETLNGGIYNLNELTPGGSDFLDNASCLGIGKCARTGSGGSSFYVNYTNLINISEGDGTINFWAYGGSHGQSALSWKTNGIYVEWQNTPQWYFGCGGEPPLVPNSPNDRWYMITIMGNASNRTFYLNGTFVGNVTGGLGGLTSTDLYIGAYRDGTTFDGYIDELGIWNRTLTESEITELFNDGIGISYGGVTTNLISPVDNNVSIDLYNEFNCSYSTGQYNISLIEFWTNITGIWEVNQTFNRTDENITSGSSIFNLTLIEGHPIIWNCNVSNTNGISSFATSNYTLNTDTNPSLTIDSPNASISERNFTISITISDYHGIDTCYYNITPGALWLESGNIILNLTTNLSNSSVSTDGNYVLYVTCNDTNNNLNITSLNFEVDTTPPTGNVTPTGGGGSSGGTTVIIGGEAQWTMETRSGGTKYQFEMFPGSIRKSEIAFENTGASIQDITLSCEGDLCDYLFFESQTITLPVSLDFKTYHEFEISLPEDFQFTEDSYITNIIATDTANNVQALTIEVNQTFGFFSKFFSKLASYTSFGLPYWLLFIGIFGISGAGLYFILFKGKPFSIISWIFGFIISIISIVLI